MDRRSGLVVDIGDFVERVDERAEEGEKESGGWETMRLFSIKLDHDRWIKTNGNNPMAYNEL